MQLVREAVDVTGDFIGAVRNLPDAGRRRLTRRAAGQHVGVDAQQGQLLAQIVVQLAGDAPPLRFLRGDEPSGEVVIAGAGVLELPLPLPQFGFRLLARGDVADHAEDRVALARHQPHLVVPQLAVQRQRVLDRPCRLKACHMGQLAHEHRREIRRHDVDNPLAEEDLRWNVEQTRIAGVIVAVDAVGPDLEHQIGNRIEHRGVSRLDVPQLDFRTAQPGALRQQRADQQRLAGHHRHGGEAYAQEGHPSSRKSSRLTGTECQTDTDTVNKC